jgi:putative ABC transport system permease protein
MMQLNNRFKRNIRHNLSFYISATLLTTISVFLLISMISSTVSMDKEFKKVLKNGHVEDAEFTTLIPMTEDDIKEMESAYNLDMEMIQYADIKEDGYTLRAFAPTEKINIYQMLEGQDLTADNEILLNRDFALAHSINVGDVFTIGGKDYTVSGLAVRPDYIYAQKERLDFYVDDDAFGQVTMTRAALAAQEHKQTYYAVVYHEDNDAQFRKVLFEKYASINYISADANNRIDLCRELATQLTLIGGVTMPFMFGMIAVIVAVVLGRMVRKDQKQIGTLVALGYRKREILRHYAIYAIIPGVLGSILGILLSVWLIKPVVIYFSSDFETLNYHASLDVYTLLIAVITPTLLYILASFLTLGRLLNKNTVLLLAGTAFGEKKKKSRFLAGSRMSFRHKFQIRSLLRNKSRTFVVIMGMFVGGFVCAIGFVMIDSFDYLIEKGLDASGSFQYQYTLNTILTDEPTEGEPMLSARFEVEGQKSLVMLSGLVEDPEYLNLSTRSGGEIEYGKYYMTSNAAKLYGVAPGDDFTFINILTAEEYTVPVEDIIRDNTQCSLYTSTDHAAALMQLPDNAYNVLLSDKEIALDENIVAQENSKEKIRDQLEASIELMMGMVYAMIIFGAALCMISVYLTVNMLVQENKVNISMLKVLGYKTKEINSLLLNTNHILLPICFVASILACLALCGAMFNAFIAELNLYIEPVIYLPSMLICLAVLVLSYWASLTLLKRKAYRVNMVESLKDNRD